MKLLWEVFDLEKLVDGQQLSPGKGPIYKGKDFSTHRNTMLSKIMENKEEIKRKPEEKILLENLDHDKAEFGIDKDKEKLAIERDKQMSI